MKRKNSRVIPLSIKNENPLLYGYGTISELLADDKRLFYEDYSDKQIRLLYEKEIDKIKKEELLRKYKIRFPKQYYWPIKDVDNDIRYVPISISILNILRNEMRNELRKKDLESRCVIPYNYFLDSNGKWIIKEIGHMPKILKKCLCNCRRCPFKYNHDDTVGDYERTGKAISLNRRTSEDGGEMVDFVQDIEGITPFKKTIIEHRKRYLVSLLMQYDEESRFIIIAKRLNIFKRILNENIFTLLPEIPSEELNYVQIAKILNKSKSTIQERGERYFKEILEKSEKNL